jgi:hypothetical protein
MYPCVTSETVSEQTLCGIYTMLQQSVNLFSR